MISHICYTGHLRRQTVFYESYITQKVSVMLTVFMTLYQNIIFGDI